MRNPYVTGAYVIGAKFYGREALLDHLTHSAGHAYWLIGTRRIGKTSTLRQLEAQALAHGQRIPIFLDMQGADTIARLGQYLADSVATYGPRFEPLGLSPTGLGEDALVILRSLRRAVLRAGRELLLLCDEAEALLRIAREEPVALQRLHRELTNGNGLRVVMASTRAIYQLHDLCADWPTSPFLEGFDLSQTLGGLTPAAVRRLATQAQALAGERVRAASATVEAVVEATNGHPYLAQVMCARLYQEDGALRPPTERDVAVEPMLRGFFSHDFNALTPSERATLLAVHRGEATGEATLLARADEPADALRRVHGLEMLGYLRREHDRLVIGNRFLAHYLSLRPESLALMPVARASEDAVQQTQTRQQAEAAGALAARLNDRRARLVALEAIRARKLLKTPSETLSEIGQLEGEIREIRRALGV
jgi:hypothetical protein